jgi:Mor family transcriptional regulator
MVQQISLAQAVSLYKSEIERNIEKASPLQREMKSFFGPYVNGKQINLSLNDLVRELAHNSSIGQKFAVQYVQSLKNQTTGELKYAVTS